MTCKPVDRNSWVETWNSSMCDSTHARPSEATCSAVVTVNQSRSGSPSVKKPSGSRHVIVSPITSAKAPTASWNAVATPLGQRTEWRRALGGDESQRSIVESSHVGEERPRRCRGIAGDRSDHDVQEESQVVAGGRERTVGRVVDPVVRRPASNEAVGGLDPDEPTQ